MRAGIAMLKALRDPGLYDRLEAQSARLAKGLQGAAEEEKIAAQVTRVGSLLTLFFLDRDPTDWTTAAPADTARFGRFFQSMLQRGIYLPPSQFEAWFVSAAHADADIDRTLAAARESLRGLL